MEKVLWVMLIVYTCSVSSKEIEDTDQLFTLSLSELMHVSVASKSKQKINYSPSIVSVYLVEQLERFGINSFEGVLDFALNVTLDPGLSGSNIVGIRGLSDARNQKMLLLVDGVPYWMPANGDTSLVAVPFIAIEKIEILRGPASIVYGTNTSAGVINIVTKSTAGSSASTHWSSSGTKKLSTFLSRNTNVGVLNFAVEKKYDSGYDVQVLNSNLPIDFDCFCFPLLPQATTQRKSENTSFYSTFSRDNLRFSLQYFENTKFALESGDVNSPTQIKELGELIAFQNSHSFNDIHLSYFIDWHRFYLSRNVKNILGFLAIPGDGEITYDNDGANNIRWRTGFQMDYSLSQFWQLTTGIEYEARQSDNYKFRDNDNGKVLFSITQPPYNMPFQLESDGSILLQNADKVAEMSQFVQLKYAGENWQSVIGARYVDNNQIGSQFSPALSLNYRISNEAHIKVLYGEGFNSPSLEQMHAHNSFGFPLDVNVKPETTQTFELSYNQTKTNFSQAMSVFQTQVSNLIATSQSTVSNIDYKIKRSGVEYEANYKKHPWNVSANFSYLFQGNKQDEKDLDARFQAKFLANVGASYQMNKHSFGGYLVGVTARAEQPSYQLVNLHYRYYQKDWEAWASVKNLLSDLNIRPNVKNFGKDAIQGADKVNLSIGFEFSIPSF
ncbi:TonB-dependent receptor plug domain-containing protein [Paraglaciecola sp.]|uniref:TonB-dependent receptor plug domain-containing protein n=1 Tax=Paraglaciecola sp. TaxID=1920173 RepID=UPI003EF1A01A